MYLIDNWLVFHSFRSSSKLHDKQISVTRIIYTHAHNDKYTYIPCMQTCMHAHTCMHTCIHTQEGGKTAHLEGRVWLSHFRWSNGAKHASLGIATQRRLKNPCQLGVTKRNVRAEMNSKNIPFSWSGWDHVGRSKQSQRGSMICCCVCHYVAWTPLTQGDNEEPTVKYHIPPSLRQLGDDIPQCQETQVDISPFFKPHPFASCQADPLWPSQVNKILERQPELWTSSVEVSIQNSSLPMQPASPLHLLPQHLWAGSPRGW